MTSACRAGGDPVNGLLRVGDVLPRPWLWPSINRSCAKPEAMTLHFFDESPLPSPKGGR